MTTTRPITTVSYNSPDFLKGVLDGLVRSGIISFYAFVSHFAEEDDLKDHIHLYVEPRQRIDIYAFVDMLKEFDITRPDKPKGCMTPRTITVKLFDDWLLYSLHYKEYLITKGEVKKYSYSIDVFETSDEDELLYRYKHILSESKFTEKMRVLNLVKKGYDISELTAAGMIPMSLALQAKEYGKLVERGMYLTERRMEIDSRAITDEKGGDKNE